VGTKVLRSQQASAEEVSAALKTELHEAFNTGERFFQPAVKVVFKDLTYETIQNESFRDQVAAAFPGLTANDLFAEYDAAPELPT